MSIHPKSVRDLSLAPVAAEIDGNLQRLRDKSRLEIEYQLSLELDVPAELDDAAKRREDVLAFAIRNVDLHGWEPVVTDDGSAIRLKGGSVTVDLALSSAVCDFVGASSTDAVTGR